ncbi:MAG TPA: DNRLRE domain-containing protein, partial [Actinomycetales bacterium]|nr:DNRLRE domain-containing protein [Actinomycetales bacterium]
MALVAGAAALTVLSVAVASGQGRQTLGIGGLPWSDPPDRKPTVTATAPAPAGLPAIADTVVVASEPKQNYGKLPYVYATPVECRAFLKFDTTGAVPAGRKLIGAVLHIYVMRADTTTPGLRVYQASASWSETVLTQANRPSQGRALSAPTPVPGGGRWLSIPLTDLSAVSTEGTTSVELAHAVGGVDLQIASRESGRA